SVTGLLLISSYQYIALQNLDFDIGGAWVIRIPNAQIWTCFLNSQFYGGDDNATYLIISDIGMPTSRGYDFINNCTFIQRFCTVLDGSNSCVGFTTTPFTVMGHRQLSRCLFGSPFEGGTWSASFNVSELK
ncbi:hypothetical protein BDR07DRAFT_1277602, partial [Suillus spraguei]